MAGMKETLKAAEQGLALFDKEKDAVIEFDTEAATSFKAEHEAAIKAKDDLVATLTGKDNKKQRAEVGKEIAAMKADERYVDACKVVKGLAPPKGNFVKGGAKTEIKKVEAPAVTEPEPEAEKKDDTKKESQNKDDKKGKKVQSAGISKAEKDELEKLKGDIIKRKAELKAQGLSGGQCNKDEQVVAWVARMQELKIKEDPTLAEADKKGKDDKKAPKKASSEEKMALEKKIEEYRVQLKQEFGYTDKDIKADPDMQDLQKQLSKMK